MIDALGRLMHLAGPLDAEVVARAQAWIEPEPPAPTFLRQPNLLPVYVRGMPVAYQLYDTDLQYQTPWGTIKPPLGLIVDGTSVPRPLWWKYPPDGLYRAAGVPHDWCFSWGGAVPELNGRVLTFEECNNIMRWVMERIEGMERHDIENIIWGVSSCFGRRAFKKSARKGPRIEPLRYKIS